MLAVIGAAGIYSQSRSGGSFGYVQGQAGSESRTAERYGQASGWCLCLDRAGDNRPGDRNPESFPASGYIISPLINDQWVWIILHWPSIRAKTSVQFQGVLRTMEPSGFKWVEKKR